MSRPTPGPSTIVPTPSPTDNAAEPQPSDDHAPPTSAEPHPLATVRSNASDAANTSLVTVTDCDTVCVAPSSSVTVSAPGYVPASVYSCEAVTPVSVVPSPKSQTYEVMVPSSSVEVEASTASSSPEVEDVKSATGATFSAGSPGLSARFERR